MPERLITISRNDFSILFYLKGACIFGAAGVARHSHGAVDEIEMVGRTRICATHSYNDQGII
jgi:hypothetical protein